MALSGGVWRITVGPYPYLTIPDGTNLDVVITATDSEGNTAADTVIVKFWSAGNCLI